MDLSRALNYVDLKKANKQDLNILESLMLEFSNELNKIGLFICDLNDVFGVASPPLRRLLQWIKGFGQTQTRQKR